MSIKRLQVKGVRNLKEVRLDDCGRINIVSGVNGSGKTSLLEAIYLLGMGRSFRSSRLSPLVNKEAEQVTVFAELLGGVGGARSLGLSRDKEGKQRFRVDKRPAAGAAELAKELPLQILDADSFALLTGGPALRRHFMDWGVFHVKPAFHDLWRRAQKALRQRNHLLRHGRISAEHFGAKASGVEPLSIEAWEQELAACAEQMNILRQEAVATLRPHFFRFLGEFVSLPELSLEYRRGWRAETDLLVLLRETRQRDAERGFTQAGPHRANLEFKVGSAPAAEFLSRGQQKLLVSALKLAQGACLAEHSGNKGVFLVDDLPAELDGQHRETLCRLLDGIGCQVFITSVDADVIDGAWLGSQSSSQSKNQARSDDIKRFHVEQGVYTCLTT